MKEEEKKDEEGKIDKFYLFFSLISAPKIVCVCVCLLEKLEKDDEEEEREMKNTGKRKAGEEFRERERVKK